MDSQFPIKFKGANASEINCFSCGQKGHCSFDCPKRPPDRGYGQGPYQNSQRGGYQGRG